MLRKSDFGAKLRCVVWGQNLHEFNYCVGDIRNSDLGEGIICLWGGGGGGSGGKGEGKWRKRGREVGVRGEGSGECLPPCPPPPIRYHFTCHCHLSFEKGW